MPIIQGKILEGSTIYTDGWKTRSRGCKRPNKVRAFAITSERSER